MCGNTHIVKPSVIGPPYSILCVMKGLSLTSAPRPSCFHLPFLLMSKLIALKRGTSDDTVNFSSE